MRFDDYADRSQRLALRGAELTGIYLALCAQEAALDAHQRSALEGIRALLYENFTIEEMENLEHSYKLRLSCASAGR